MYLKTENFMVMGLSRSGAAAGEFLLARGAKVYLYDDSGAEEVKKTIDKLCSLGAEYVPTEQLENAEKLCSCLVISPGVPIDNPVPVLFKKHGKRILGESELGALYVKALPIAVTGTNGKTTTVSMIDEVFKAANKNSVACGNNGVPYISQTSLTEDDFAVVEISSFQLETLSSFRPHIAIILNITKDHLNRHYNMENYVFLKSKLLKNGTESEYAVLNADDERVAAFAEKTRSRVKYFSLEREVDGAYLDGTELVYCGEKIMNVDSLTVKGKHNVQNALACICTARIMGIDGNIIAKALKQFKGVQHRIEFVGEINGVRFIDDSKGTNVDATVKAVDCMNGDTILMLGGKDKGYDYGVLFERLKNSRIIHTVIYGENRFKLLNAAVKEGFDKLSLCEKFNTAFKITVMLAERGQTVLLSPASASFDEFSSFEERGDEFKRLFFELDGEENV